MDSDSTEFEVLELIAGFIRALQPEVVVETGTAFGYGAEAIGNALFTNRHGKLYTFEVDQERCSIARRRCEGLPVHVVNLDVRQVQPEEKINFAFFDSLTELREGEYRHLYPFIPKGSIVCFHDAAPHHDVWPSVKRLESEGLLKSIRLRTPRGVAFCEVL